MLRHIVMGVLTCATVISALFAMVLAIAAHEAKSVAVTEQRSIAAMILLIIAALLLCMIFVVRQLHS